MAHKKKQPPIKNSPLSHLLSLADDQQFATAFLTYVDQVLAKYFPPDYVEDGELFSTPIPSVGYGDPLGKIWDWVWPIEHQGRGQPRRVHLAAVRAYIAQKEGYGTWNEIYRQFGAVSESAKSLKERERAFRQLIEDECKIDLWKRTCGLDSAS